MNEERLEREKYQKMTMEVNFPKLSPELARKLVKWKQYKLMAIDSRKAMIQIQNDLFFVEIDQNLVKIETKLFLHSIKAEERMISCSTFKEYLFVFVQSSNLGNSGASEFEK